MSHTSGFRLAKEHFDQNLRIIKRPECNTELWNLSIGLSQLAEALEAELEVIDRKLNNIESDISGLR
jgi:hypothetical protein